MRRAALVVGGSLLVWACSGGASPATTTVPPPSTPSTSTFTASTTPSVPETVWPEILVSNDDGVFYVDAAGDVTQLVKGRVAYAVDDTRGGLLFQVERGRSSVWAPWQFGDHLKDTTVWWVPRDSAGAQALLVPTGGAGHDLVLYDAYEDDDGHLRVVYVRTYTPVGEGSHPEDMTDSLRVFEVEAGAVVEVWEERAFEQGFRSVSVGAGLLAMTSWEQVESHCLFLDPVAALQPGYQPNAREAGGPNPVDVSGAPPVEACEDSCPAGCVLSAEGRLLAYTTGSTVTVVRREPLGEERRFEFDHSAGALDLTASHLLVNQWVDWGLSDERPTGPATLVDLESGDRQLMLLEGLARFVTAPIHIGGSAIPPTPVAIQSRADGLGVVNFGDPVEGAAKSLAVVLGEPTTDEIGVEGGCDMELLVGAVHARVAGGVQSPGCDDRRSSRDPASDELVLLGVGW